jgi:23S rRNA pseudouridine1911/1915/1917 synthase
VIHTIGTGDQGKTIVDWLCARLKVSRKEANDYLQRRKVRINGTPCNNPTWRLRAGARVEVKGTERTSVADSPPITIRYVEKAIVVVEKPAGLTTMRHADEAAEFGARGKRYLPATLQDLLPNLLAKPRPVRAVHRLDRDTTGLVVFALTTEAESALGTQFRNHSVKRLYQAIVRGHATSTRIESWLLQDRGDGRRGSGKEGEGQRAVTHVRVVEALGEYTLVECQLETGRTHQVRIHLGEAGTPLCGERVYDRPLHGRPLPDGSNMKRIALHAATLGLAHPVTGEMMKWSAPMPGDMMQVIKRLRGESEPRTK